MKFLHLFSLPIILLLAHPRSLSTAFERIMRERGDFTVLNEPLSYLYYLKHFPDSPDLASFPEEFPQTYPEMIEWLHSLPGPLFIKDMAFTVEDLSILDDVKLMLLYRDPKKSLPSLYRMEPDCEYEFVGFEALSALTDRADFILNADDLEADPEKSYRTFCEIMGIEFIPEALEFKKETPPDWNVKWFETVRTLKRIEKRPCKDSIEKIPLKDRPRWMRYYCESLPHYEKLVGATPRLDHVD